MYIIYNEIINQTSISKKEIRKKCQNKVKTNILRAISSPVWMFWLLLSRLDQVKVFWWTCSCWLSTKLAIRKCLSYFRLENQCWNVHALFFLAFVFVLEPKDLHSLLIRWGPENIFAKLNLLSCQCCFSSRVNIS